MLDRASGERGIIAAAALSATLAPLNSTMIVVALPAILSQFHRSLAWGSWLVVAYLVTMATVQPVAGSLGDRVGRRRLMLLGLIGFLAASLVAALANHIELLLLARIAQALFGAVAIPNGTALVREQLPASHQGHAAGMIGAVIAIAAGVGPSLGGLITDAAGWRWIFAANLVPIAPALLLLMWLAPGPAPRQARRFDLTGAALLAGSLVSLVLAVTLPRVHGVPRSMPLGLGLLALVAGPALWRHLRRTPHPLIDPSLLRAPGYAAAVSAVLLTNLAMYTVLLSLPIFLTTTSGWRPGATGLLLSGLSLQMILFSPLGGRWSDRRGFRLPAVSGALLLLGGLLPLVALAPSWHWPMFLAAVVVIGIGTGLVTAPIQASAILAVPASRAGQAAGLFSTMRYLGSIAGTTLMSLLLPGEHASPVHYRLLYAALCLAAVVAVAVCSRLPSQAHEHLVEPAGEPLGATATMGR